MNDLSSFRTATDPVVVQSAAPEIAMAFRQVDVFELIERTAETIRSLKHDNKVVEAREQELRAQLVRDRALWRSDLKKLQDTVEACIERATSAENEAVQAKTQARIAVQLCKETYAREKVAVTRAEAAEERARLAEEWMARFGAKLSSEFVDLLDHRAPAHSEKA